MERAYQALQAAAETLPSRTQQKDVDTSAQEVMAALAAARGSLFEFGMLQRASEVLPEVTSAVREGSLSKVNSAST